MKIIYYNPTTKEPFYRALFFCVYLWKDFKMIDAVRNTVLAILNKNNYGYLSPSDFNLYAQQVKLEIFEDYFY